MTWTGLDYLWAWLIGIIPVIIGVSRYAMWLDFDEFWDEPAFSFCIVSGIGILWPLAVLFGLVFIIACPKQKRREIWAEMTQPRGGDIERMTREDLIMKVKYLENEVEKHAQREIKKLRKQYEKSGV